MTYTIEPIDHWKAGDRAYCLRGLRLNGRHVVEAGRIYAVTEVKQTKGMMSDGLRLCGIDTGEAWGFSSNRFVCIRGRALPLKQIAERTRRGWLEAYETCRDARELARAA